MPRPGIVRADTLDLQDPNSPSAQDHSRLSASFHDFDDSKLIGAHQAAELRHASRERQDEQRHLQNGWAASDRDQYDDDPHHDRHLAMEGSPQDDGDTDIVIDDDLMGGRISSSPSIDEGTSDSRCIDPAQDASSKPNALYCGPQPCATSEEAPVLAAARTSAKSILGPDSTRPSMCSHADPSELEIASEDKHQQGKYGPAAAYRSKESFLMQPFSTEAGQHRQLWNTSAPYFFDDDESNASTMLDCTDPCHIQDDSDQSGSNSDDSWSTLSDTSDNEYSKLDWDAECMNAVKDADLDANPPCTMTRLLDSSDHDECLRLAEDIDFDFVYALHTFIATVEGQANATKGDTMVLLDDSNSYWWLVRLVKDSSIGYLPAEHIETPTERLARLNKHRNIELSAAMLSDGQDKPRKQNKKGMRRRNAKAVQFAAPTYVEPSDYDYTSDEDDASPEDAMAHTVAQQADQGEPHMDEQQKPTTQIDTTTPAANTSTAIKSPEEVSATSLSPSSPLRDTHGHDEPLSPKMIDRNEAAPLKASRKGTPRNADSFLRDETAEPQKMSLTPGWLARDDSVTQSPDADGNSIDSLERQGADKSKKDDKKRKEKKGVLGGLFKRKDKKEDKTKKKDELEVAALNSADDRSSPRPSKESDRVERKDSKKSKTDKPGRNQTDDKPVSRQVAELEGSQVAHEAPTGREDEIQETTSRTKARLAKTRKTKPQQANKGLGAPDQDDSSPPEVSPTFMHGTEVVHIPDTPTRDEFDAQEKLAEGRGAPQDNDVADAPVSVIDESIASVNGDADDEPPSAIEPSPTEDTFREQETNSVVSRDVTPQPNSMVSPVAGSSETGFRGDDSVSLVERQGSKSSTTTISTGSRHVHSPTDLPWSDASLRAWLDGDNNDVRDMLVMVHDTSDVKPVSAEHPLMASLFVDESLSLKKMSDELDSMLEALLRRKTTNANANTTNDGGPVQV